MVIYGANFDNGEEWDFNVNYVMKYFVTRKKCLEFIEGKGFAWDETSKQWTRKSTIDPSVVESMDIVEIEVME